MSVLAYTSVPYALARLAIWAALPAVAALDGARHRDTRSRGWQLFGALLAAAAAFTLRNAAFLALVATGASSAWLTYLYILLSDAADSVRGRRRVVPRRVVYTRRRAADASPPRAPET